MYILNKILKILIIKIKILIFKIMSIIEYNIEKKRMLRNRKIYLTLDETNFTMIGENYERNYKNENIFILEKKTNKTLKIIVNSLKNNKEDKKVIELISQNCDKLINEFKNMILNYNYIIKGYLIYEKDIKKKITEINCCILNDNYFICYVIKEDYLEKIITINLTKIINVYSMYNNIDDKDNFSFTIELNNNEKYNFKAKDLKTKQKWIKKIGIAIIKKKYPNEFNENKDNINDKDEKGKIENDFFLLN